MMVKGNRIYRSRFIAKDILSHMENKKGFSLARYGDNELRIFSIYISENSITEMKGAQRKLKQQGLNPLNYEYFCPLNIQAGNNANYISNFDIYFTARFWTKHGSQGCKNMARQWKSIYDRVGITNTSYCNPEVSFMLFLNREGNLLEDLKGKKICFIGSYPDLPKIFEEHFESDIISIPGEYGKHYMVYKDTVKKIEDTFDRNYDIYLLGAGFIGRIYSERIRCLGGVALDLGQVFDAWVKGVIPPRMVRFVGMKDRFTFRLKKSHFDKSV